MFNTTLNKLFERPSRLLGWGVVAIVHVFGWLALTNGLNWVKVIPVLSAVQVSLIDNDPPVETPTPPLPKIEQPVNIELFVPAPEVRVTQESAMVVAATITPPPAVMADTAPPAAPSEAHSISPLVVDESEVDYLVRPEVKYPPASKRAKEHGTVLLAVIVNSQGMVEYVRLHRSSGYRRLDETAIRAIYTMRVKPYVRNGIAMAIELRVPVEFS